MTKLDLDDIQRRMNGAVANLKSQFCSLRSGRASVNMLDSVMVDAYGTKIPVNQVSTISVIEHRMLSVQVWDVGMSKVVEKAIRDSDLGLNPQSCGKLIHIPLPDLSEERSKRLKKIAAKYAENAKVAVRNVRRDGMDILKKLEKDSSLSRDDRRLYEQDIQEFTKTHVKEIDEALEEKDKDIMQV
ncbi:ribosome recycling factor [Candidatus Endolissoclinum faulkneri L5]|uniref:Ribosome-recycling factor n=1 Tax=Candidatus Endolissoclinum faulkneri L5 TaxID=1401328 RepID=V9TWK5_9PROT|nr:ribosome recycling factor [Candidatus Endolissoclinum faulkneri]AHC73680.1 ribosome recycling factor [Candidatus Endolissoclinum faulkneri L5]